MAFLLDTSGPSVATVVLRRTPPMGTTTRTIDRRECDLCGEVEDVTRGPTGRMRGRWFSAEFEDLKGSPASEEEREHWPRDYAPPGGETTGPWLPLILCGTCCTMAIHSLKRLRTKQTEQRHRRQLTNISAEHLEASGVAGALAFPSVPVSKRPLPHLPMPFLEDSGALKHPRQTVNEEVAEVRAALTDLWTADSADVLGAGRLSVDEIRRRAARDERRKRERRH
jgi:hypothetical protein